MAYKKVRSPYTFYYNDGTFLTYDLDADDYQAISLAMLNDQTAVVLPDLGLFKLGDIRSLVKQKPEPKAPKSAVPDMNAKDAEWYAQQMPSWENYGKDDEGGIAQ